MKNLTLILNADDTPLNVASAYRAFNLVFKGKAIVVRDDHDHPIHSELKTFKRPTIVRLTNYIYIPHRKTMPLTRQNVYNRDGHKCAYCNSTKKLTLDHITPKSKGGKNTWLNLVTCCSKCNCKKDNKTPSEANMVLKIKPYVPNYADFIVSDGASHTHWVEYFKEKNTQIYA